MQFFSFPSTSFWSSICSLEHSLTGDGFIVHLGSEDLKSGGLIGVFDFFDWFKKRLYLNRVFDKMPVRQDNVDWLSILEEKVEISDCLRRGKIEVWKSLPKGGIAVVQTFQLEGLELTKGSLLPETEVAVMIITIPNDDHGRVVVSVLKIGEFFETILIGAGGEGGIDVEIAIEEIVNGVETDEGNEHPVWQAPVFPYQAKRLDQSEGAEIC